MRHESLGARSGREIPFDALSLAPSFRAPLALSVRKGQWERYILKVINFLSSLPIVSLAFHTHRICTGFDFPR